MGQVTIYLDRETENKLRLMVKTSGMSLSKWLAELIRAKTETEWPDSVRRLAGAWKDLPTAEEIRRGLVTDADREEWE
jgi:hypothetical protein